MNHRKFAILSIALLVFQLGVCTCSCFHENLWYQSAAAVLGQSDDHCDHECSAIAHDGGSRVSVPDDHDHDCQSCGRLLFVSDSSVAAASGQCQPVDHWAGVELDDLSVQATGQRFAGDCAALFCETSADMRALLGVYHL